MFCQRNSPTIMQKNRQKSVRSHPSADHRIPTPLLTTTTRHTRKRPINGSCFATHAKRHTRFLDIPTVQGRRVQSVPAHECCRLPAASPQRAPQPRADCGASAGRREDLRPVDLPPSFLSVVSDLSRTTSRSCCCADGAQLMATRSTQADRRCRTATACAFARASC